MENIPPELVFSFVFLAVNCHYYITHRSFGVFNLLTYCSMSIIWQELARLYLLESLEAIVLNLEN